MPWRRVEGMLNCLASGSHGVGIGTAPFLDIPTKCRCPHRVMRRFLEGVHGLSSAAWQIAVEP
jgi:hypothetical protein